ncbi:hypothetical protein TCAL_08700 [Tigriopus californicus]|uniref:Uncharacterized protein n=1 Tax=Tigriopus californicus TaxID=6832 RepID=A0A553ND73_TIGCA|nr:hypothetical protein TCAL_08700 [Tigriopus californicus]
MINSHDYIHNFDKLEPKMQQVLLNEHDEVALEMFLGGLSILIASLLLIHGLKKEKKKLDRSGRYTSTGSLSTEMQSMSNESFEDPKQPSDA